MDADPDTRGDLGLQIKPFVLPVVLGTISLSSVVLAIFLLYRSSTSSDPIEFIDGDEASRGAVLAPEAQIKLIIVDVAGGVKNPGVYKLPAGSRIDDAITMAGGLSENVSSSLLEKVLNRAQKISDGAKVYIPQKTDEDASHNLVVGGEVSSDNTSHNNNGDQVRGFKIISINSASQAQLEELPGVGPVTAGKIISGRPYTDLQELTSRKVITAKIFERILGQISL